MNAWTNRLACQNSYLDITFMLYIAKPENEYTYLFSRHKGSLYGFDKQGYFPTFTAVNMEPY